MACSTSLRHDALTSVLGRCHRACEYVQYLSLYYLRVRVCRRYYPRYSYLLVLRTYLPVEAVSASTSHQPCYPFSKLRVMHAAGAMYILNTHTSRVGLGWVPANAGGTLLPADRHTGLLTVLRTPCQSARACAGAHQPACLRQSVETCQQSASSTEYV